MGGERLRAVVTGGNRGLGAALGAALLDADALVVLAARTADGLARAERVARQWPARAWAVELDHSRPETITDAARRCATFVDGVDLLVNCGAVNVAGSWPRPASKGPLEHLSGDALTEMFTVNVVGPVLTCQAFAPLLAAAPRPWVINISTRRASLTETDADNSFGYAVTKAALNMCTRKLAPRLAELGGGAVSIDPGWVATRMGGPDAPTPPRDAAEAVLRLWRTGADRLNGRFVDTTGADVPW